MTGSHGVGTGGGGGRGGRRRGRAGQSGGPGHRSPASGRDGHPGRRSPGWPAVRMGGSAEWSARKGLRSLAGDDRAWGARLHPDPRTGGRLSVGSEAGPPVSRAGAEALGLASGVGGDRARCGWQTGVSGRPVPGRRADLGQREGVGQACWNAEGERMGRSARKCCLVAV